MEIFLILFLCLILFLLVDPNILIKINPYLFCDLVLSKNSKEILFDVLNGEKWGGNNEFNSKN